MSIEQRDCDGAPALRAWLDAARDDLGAREPPVWLQFQLRERLAERAALSAVRGARESPAADAKVAGATWRGAVMRWRPGAPRRWLARAAVATTGVALVIGLAVLTPMRSQSVRGDAAVVQAQGELAPFIALASLDAIAAESGATVVPARLPRTSLVDFGLPVDPARADVPLIAEFLMSPRGVVLAVRFVE